MDSTLTAGILAFIGLLANIIWSYYSFRQQRKDAAENTKQLTQIQIELATGTRRHDHRTQTLHRALEALNKAHKNLTYIRAYTRSDDKLTQDIYAARASEAEEGIIELGGIAIAIKDKELIRLLTDEGFLAFDAKQNEDDLKQTKKSTFEAAMKIHSKLTRMLEDTI